MLRAVARQRRIATLFTPDKAIEPLATISALSSAIVATLDLPA
jgi:hypothetical protein